jgi:hypothetical protein
MPNNRIGGSLVRLFLGHLCSFGPETSRFEQVIHRIGRDEGIVHHILVVGCAE